MLWKTLQTETVYDSLYVTLHKDKVELPNGVQIDDYYTVTLANAAMIVAITKDNNLLLKKEFRYSCGEELIECPAGTFEKDETDPLVVAKRELLEETGYTSTDWIYLGETRENTSKLTNIMYLFLAKECVKTGEQHLDISEHIELITVPIKQAVDMVMENEIHCSTSAHGILRAARMMGV